MPFKDTLEGQTHFQNDGCGIPEHNTPSKKECSHIKYIKEEINKLKASIDALKEQNKRLQSEIDELQNNFD